MAEHERAGGPEAEIPSERQRAEGARQGVGGDRQADEQAESTRRSDAHREPGDRDCAHPVAERGDAEPGQQSPGSTFSQQHPIRVPVQRTASRTRAAIFFSSATVSFGSAYTTGHIEPSSSLALSLKPKVAYRSLNLVALRK